MRESSATRRKRKDTSSGEHPQPGEWCNETIRFGARKLYCGRSKGHPMKPDGHQSAVMITWGGPDD